MPTVFRVWGLKIRIYPKDHNPPHVHVIGANAEAKIEIQTLDVIFSRGFSASSLKELQEFIAQRRAKLMEKWNDYCKED